ncbi:uncharacterized protein LOC134681161 [Mytilus trossulus]|uniref:uncharacterized protein LOC134681161 n=1 Tax=Mytilus trossulus TaxID=6551 RepID=UPI0030053B8A
MATTNCSYTDNSNYYQDLQCASNEFCCTGSSLNTCSSTICSTSASSSSSSSISPTLFWSILGGLFGAGILLIFLMYIICKFKSANSCLSDEHVHDAEMFEEERHEINTVTHQQSHHQPRFYIRRESFWKITRRKSSNSNIVCRQCEQTRERNQDKNNKTRKDDVEMKNNIVIIKNVANQKCSKTKTVLALPDVG